VCAVCDDTTHGPAGPLTRARRTLSVGEVAARLEHRLYIWEPTQQTLRDGCAFAVRHGLSSVIALPADVPVVGLHWAGTSVVHVRPDQVVEIGIVREFPGSADDPT
jgi:hypothetical protein